MNLRLCVRKNTVRPPPPNTSDPVLPELQNDICAARSEGPTGIFEEAYAPRASGFRVSGSQGCKILRSFLFAALL